MDTTCRHICDPETATEYAKVRIDGDGCGRFVADAPAWAACDRFFRRKAVKFYDSYAAAKSKNETHKCPTLFTKPVQASRMHRLLGIGVLSIPTTKPWARDLVDKFKAEMRRQIEVVGTEAAHDVPGPDRGPHQGPSTAAAPLFLVFVHSESRVSTVVRVRVAPVRQHGTRRITWLFVNAGGQRWQDGVDHTAFRPLLCVVAAGASRRRGTTSWWPTAVVHPGKSSPARWPATVAAYVCSHAAANTRGTLGTMGSGLCCIVHPLLVLLVCLQAGGAGRLLTRLFLYVLCYCARCVGWGGWVCK